MQTERERLAGAARRIAEIGWDVDPVSGCWNWRGPTYNGRAKYNLSTGTRNVARILWEAEHGIPAPGLEVCHTCHNKLCVNLDHCFLGTHARNMEDTRGVPKRKSGRRPTITQQQDEHVRRLYDAGASMSEAAGELGVGVDVIRSSIRRTGAVRSPGRRRKVA